MKVLFQVVSVATLITVNIVELERGARRFQQYVIE
jgi:hypothetical protein